MTRTRTTEKQLQGKALSSLGAYPCLVAGEDLLENPAVHVEAADRGLRFRRG
jgi:hypothetical protein